MIDLNAARRWVAALSDASSETRDWGRARLLDSLTLAVPALIEALGEPFGRHGTAAALLAHLGAEEAILPLRLCLARERDRGERDEIEAALEYLEKRVRFSRRRENGLRLLHEAQPFLGRALSREEREQVTLVFALGVELCTTPMPENGAEPVDLTPPEPPFPETIEGLVKLIDHYQPSVANRVFEALRIKGDEAVPAMRQALSAGRPAQAARPAVLLGELGDLPSISILLRVWPDLASGQTRLIVLRVLVTLAKKLAVEPTAIPISTLRGFLSFAKVQFRPEEAYFVAVSIERLAKSAPSPELRTLLPLLKGRWLNPVPPSFERARLAIEEATEEWKDLPLPALADDRSNSLPLPARSKELAQEELPRPTEKTKP